MLIWIGILVSLQLDLLFVIEYHLDFGRSEKRFKEKNEVPDVLFFQCSSMFISNCCERFSSSILTPKFSPWEKTSRTWVPICWPCGLNGFHWSLGGPKHQCVFVVGWSVWTTLGFHPFHPFLFDIPWNSAMPSSGLLQLHVFLRFIALLTFLLPEKAPAKPTRHGSVGRLNSRTKRCLDFHCYQILIVFGTWFRF